MIVRKTRRRAIAGLIAVMGGLFAWRKVQAVGITPDATEGPFYPLPAMRYPDSDNDLVKIAGMVKDAGGEIINLKGRVLRQDGDPVVGARVEIWQCDVTGHYLHTSDYDPVDADPAFQGFGHDITDGQGNYSFRTIKPVPYGWRTPHIHVKVIADQKELLTTQFYIKGHPQNPRDRIFRRMSAPQREAVEMTFAKVAGVATSTVHIIV